MIDANTNQPMKIQPAGEQGGYLRLPAEQVDAVVNLFLDHGLRCWRNPEISSADGGPWRGTVYLSRNVKPDAAQAVLDSVP